MVNSVSGLISVVLDAFNNVLPTVNNAQDSDNIEFPSEQDDEGEIVDVNLEKSYEASSAVADALNKLPLIQSTCDFDSDGDGVVTPEEIESQLDSNTLAALFKDENGKLDDAMILALGVAGGIGVEELYDNIKIIDTNGDGVISEDEIEAFKNSAEYQKYQNIAENTQSTMGDFSELTNNFFK